MIIALSVKQWHNCQKIIESVVLKCCKILLNVSIKKIYNALKWPNKAPISSTMTYAGASYFTLYFISNLQFQYLCEK